MTVSRRTRLSTALMVLLSLLYMQLAMASYRCPVNGAGSMTMAATADTSAQSMPCLQPMAAASMDPGQPNLCQAHCQADARASHKVDPPLPADLAGWEPVAVTLASLSSPRTRPSLQASQLRRATSPPLSILHCCWRI